MIARAMPIMHLYQHSQMMQFITYSHSVLITLAFFATGPSS